MQKEWRITTVTSLVFFAVYLIVQQVVLNEVRIASALTGAVAFWLVSFIVQKALHKQLK